MVVNTITEKRGFFILTYYIAMSPNAWLIRLAPYASTQQCKRDTRQLAEYVVMKAEIFPL
jgi:hypothetical protein